MSASLVRKALDETSFASEEKLDQLSKASKKKFKPKKSKKVEAEKLLKQNLKILKALEYKTPTKKSKSETGGGGDKNQVLLSSKSSLKQSKTGKKKKNKEEGDGSVFTEEDFEKFEKEYFVS